MFAEYVDEDYRLQQAGLTQVKENFKQPVCIHGVGSGKSALLSNGLALLTKHCRNKDVCELLKEENCSIAIHITFNAKTRYSREYETNFNFSVIRRILASCLDMNWDDARLLPLGESLLVVDCLTAIMSYHREMHEMREDKKLFVYLGIDEVNQLVYYPGSGAKPDTTSLKGIVRALQSLSPRNGFVSTLLAGTHFADMTESFLGSGINALYLKMTILSDKDIEKILLTDAGVSQKYILNRKFQELLQGVGPMMRAIGIAISKLEYEYNENSISDAKSGVQSYLKSNRKSLTSLETQALFGLVLTGRTIVPSDPICAGSSISLDDLQNYGTISLVPSHQYDRSSVFISRIMLDSFMESDTGRGSLADSAKRLLGFIDSHGHDSFEKFAAHFHGMKKAVFLEKSPYQSVGRVPITSFFSGALIGKELLNQELLLKPASVPLDFHDGVMWWQGQRYPDPQRYEKKGEAIETDLDSVKLVREHFMNGGIVLNSSGAAVDVVVDEKVRDIDSSDWQEGVTVYAMKHTIVGDRKLSLENISDDRGKAVDAFAKSKNHPKALVTVVHFSNRELPKKLGDVRNWKAEWGRSIIVCRSNINDVVGPMFGRMLTSKGFYGIGRQNKTFSTLARAVPVGVASKVKVPALLLFSLLFRLK